MRKSVVIFPGQGAQYVGMGKGLLESETAVEIMDSVNKVLGFDLKELCFNGPIEELTKTENSQVAIYSMGYIAYKLLLENLGSDWKPEYFAGLSLGEFTALAVAGVYDFEDGLKLVYKRGQFMKQACIDNPGAMASIMGASREDLKVLIDKYSSDNKVITMANLNCPSQIVISGEKDVVAKVVAESEEKGFRAIVLKVSGAFHSDLMESARIKLSEAVEEIEFRDPLIPVISNCDASVKTKGSDIKQALVKQMVSSVLWEDSVKYMLEQGVDFFIEPGCGRILKGLLRKIDRSATCINVEKIGDIEKVATELNQVVA